MGQQTIDSKFSEYGLASIETSLPNQQRHTSVPAATKKTALRDIKNDSTVVAPESVVGPNLLKKSKPCSEFVDISGNKRSMPDSSSQTITSNANGQLVYVRRKVETDLGKNNAADNKRNRVNSPQSREVGDRDEKAQEKLQQKDSKISVPDIQYIPSASEECFSSGKPSKSSNVVSMECHPLRVTSANALADCNREPNFQQLEERYSRLQNLLKKLDQSGQNDYIQMLRSVSSVDLSRHAIELEKRSIQLSLDEAKEMQKVKFLDILKKYQNV